MISPLPNLTTRSSTRNRAAEPNEMESPHVPPVSLCGAISPPSGYSCAWHESNSFSGIQAGPSPDPNPRELSYACCARSRAKRGGESVFPVLVVGLLNMRNGKGADANGQPAASSCAISNVS
eukprot:CAMPEP_0184490630 /NCGR_PEP_ID=MMETSP0113_2-20130426/18420_1 /TAXON_ID=91329 /ORGANISM="Norrisiella sphaerica, Strain BC52" /LENGTH=121 /DNA_ID=CAMNT_0026874603 /DNA_START=256 /DNA_END=621 /DNA_ORIENTATION=+